MADIRVSERDPRVNPIRGDVLRWDEPRESIERAVLEVVPRIRVPLVKFRTTFVRARNTIDFQLGLNTWRNWAAGATVIRRGDDEAAFAALEAK